ncbi:hypothetical protein EVAR_7770_1 [Eumeta japonica]|uniref:Uncharacterized protein n=1 Tax=Eumeta variegata TaxID=151549 RepID=A0A4C1TLK9_EUMVA|nr:hypothetical protein EVAR_7770_1 [Eumeta japonica]
MVKLPSNYCRILTSSLQQNLESKIRRKLAVIQPYGSGCYQRYGCICPVCQDILTAYRTCNEPNMFILSLLCSWRTRVRRVLARRPGFILSFLSKMK